MKRTAATLVTIGLLVLVLAPPGTAQELTVAVEPHSVEVVVGEEGTLDVTIANVGSGPSGPLVAHLVVIDPAGGGSADAEDWTTELNRLIDSLESGDSHTIAWDTKPIMQGTYLAVITVSPVTPSPEAAAASPAIRFVVRQPNVLVSGVTVPVSAAVPVGLLAVALWARRRESARVATL